MKKLGAVLILIISLVGIASAVVPPSWMDIYWKATIATLCVFINFIIIGTDKLEEK